MFVIVLSSEVYVALATGVLFLHVLFITWVVFGAFLTRSRPVLGWVHIASLFWGIFAEILPWSCPLTIAENWLESRAGIQPYQGGFLLHRLDALVYPNISSLALTSGAVAVCVLNLAAYARRFWKLREPGSNLLTRKSDRAKKTV